MNWLMWINASKKSVDFPYMSPYVKTLREKNVKSQYKATRRK